MHYARNLFLPFALFAATFQAAAVSIENASLSSVSCDVLDPPTATVTATGATWVRAEVWGDWTPNGYHGAYHCYLAQSGNVWSGKLPVDRAGTVFVAFAAGDDATGEVVTTANECSYVATENVVSSDALGPVRRPVWGTAGAWYKAWYSLNGTAYSGTVGGWTGTNVRMSGATFISLYASTTSVANRHPQIATSEAIKAGTIWFKARSVSTEYDATLIVERIVNGTRTTIQTVTIPAMESESDITWTQYQIVLQDATEGQICFRNPTRASDIEGRGVQLTDIVITPPQPDVKFYRYEADYAPGFPSIQDPVVFRVAVSNVYDAAQTVNLTPKLVWRQDDGVWHVTEMTNVLGRTVQTDGEYAAVLTEHVAGAFEYFFRADFAGYTPTFEAVNPVLVARAGVTSPVEELRFNDEGDRVSFNTNPAAEPRPISRVDNDFNYFEFDPFAVSVVSHSPAYSPDLSEWLAAGCAAEVEPFIDRTFAETKPPLVLDKWELGHRFDVENLYGGWLKTLAACSEEVILDDEFPYYSLQAKDGVRRFRSSYGVLQLSIADHREAEAPSLLDPEYPMQQVGDYTWQSIIRLTNTIDVAVSVTGAWKSAESGGAFEQGPFEWGEVAQDETSINPPMSGTLTGVGPDDEFPAEWEPVRTQITYTGFLMFRFCTTNGSYQIRRAAWQDFNAWQSDDEWFSRSFGLYNTKTFENDVDSVAPTTDDITYFNGVETLDTSEEMLASTFGDGLKADNVWIVEERVRSEKTDYSSTEKNKAWRLSTAAKFPGTLQTTSMRRADGRGTLKMRVRAHTDDDRAVVYGASAAAGWTNKRFVGKFGEAVLSDGKPSFSVYGYWRDPNNYWEARLTQESVLYGVDTGKKTDSEAASLTLELFVRENGVLRRVAGNTWTGNKNNTTYLLNRSGGQILLDLDLFTNGGSVIPRVYVLWSSNFGSATTEPGRFVNNQFQLTPGQQSTTVTSGTVGYNTRDCEAKVSPYVFEWNNGTTSTTSMTDEAIVGAGSHVQADLAVSTSAQSEWYAAAHDGSMLYQGDSPWTVRQGTSVGAAPTTFLRDGHQASFRVKVYRSGEEEATDWVAPVPTYTTDWDASWDDIHRHAFDTVRTVSSYSWTDIEIPMSFWDDTYLMVEALPAGSGGVASTASLLVDDIQCTSWLGKTVWHEDYGIDSVNAIDSWKATYAAVDDLSVGGFVDHVYDLDRTRANPAEIQGIETPLLENGVGDLLFSYRAENAPVMFRVEHIDSRSGAVNPYLVVTAAVSQAWTSRYIPVLDSGTGRIRIRTQRLYDANGREVFGRLLVNNLRATDYPNDEDSSWEAYNVLVSTFRTNSALHASLSQVETLGLKFDGPANPSDYRSAVLNDWPTHDTVQNLELNAYKPYVQTPSIATGVGEVSFWYRRSPDTADTPRLRLLAAPVASPLEEDWTEITADDLNPDSETYEEQLAALEAISAIDVDDWTYFTAEFYLKDYKVLRIVGQTNGTNRVMLDNVLITEPVRSSIDVGSIEFDPGIPLVTGDVGATVKLVNPRMGPYDIDVKLDYYVGTNRWGYAAWKDHKTGSLSFTNTLSTLPNGTIRTNVYDFASVDRIPHFKVDDVVQYCAVVTYKGTFPSPILSETQGQTDNGFWFENPPWYEPTDLNKTFGTTNQPVAHYWVFSCTTNVVWINEVKYLTSTDRTRDPVGAQANQFVEIIGPEGASLAGWTLETIGTVNGYLVADYVKWTNTMVRGATFQPPNNASEGNPKGWGFWTLGCYGLYPAQADQELFPEEASTSTTWTDGHPFLDYLGALRLRRSMGADVDKICWGQLASRKENVMDEGYVDTRYVSTAGYGIAFEYDEAEVTWRARQASLLTIGGYNVGEEEAIATVNAVEEEGDEPAETPLFGQPDIVSFSFVDSSTVELTFTVSVTNGIALEADSGWTWRVEEASDVDEPYWGLVNGAVFQSEVAAAADGTPSTVTVRVPYPSEAEARFYRIKAVRED